MGTKTTRSSVYDACFINAYGYKYDISQNVTYFRSKTWSSKPNFQKLIANKQNATTPLTAYEELVKVQPGILVATAKNSPVYTNTYVGLQAFRTPQSNFNPTLVMIEEARAKAQGDFYRLIRSGQTPFQAQVFAGELKETIGFLRNPFEKTAKLLKAGLSLRRDTPKRFADWWLENRFALMPLVYDAQNILEELNRQAYDGLTIRQKAYGKSEIATSEVYENGVYVGPFKVYISWKRTTKVENYIRFGQIFKLLDSNASIFSRLSSSAFDVSMLPTTIWELTPFSWLVDYWVNVGDIINASFTSTANVTYVSNSLVSTFEDTRTAYTAVITDFSQDPKILRFEPKSVTSKVRKVTRDSASGGIPPLTFTIPGSNIRLANMAALFASLTLK